MADRETEVKKQSTKEVIPPLEAAEPPTTESWEQLLPKVVSSLDDLVDRYTMRAPEFPTEDLFTLSKRGVHGDEPMPATVQPSKDAYGPFHYTDFVTDPTTQITWAHTADGKPIVLRVLNQFDTPAGPILECLDDNGQNVLWLVNTIRDNTLEVEL